MTSPTKVTAYPLLEGMGGVGKVLGVAADCGRALMFNGRPLASGVFAALVHRRDLLKSIGPDRFLARMGLSGGQGAAQSSTEEVDRRRRKLAVGMVAQAPSPKQMAVSSLHGVANARHSCTRS